MMNEFYNNSKLVRLIHAASFSLVCWIDFRQFPFWREKLNAESIYNNKQTELIKAALNQQAATVKET